ncbi:MAG: beta-lactamase family protein [Flavobacteriales bacterium]|nr:beta-lactamase family protein [Flavobacteriales bacterium]
MRNINSQLTLIAILLALAINTHAQKRTSFSKVDSIIEAHFEADKPGVAFAIIQNTETIYQRTLGLANVEYNIPISDSTLFGIASNSKQMTTFLALMIEAEGLLSMNDEIAQHLPELKDLPYPITLKQLTNHTHGLPNVDELAQLKGTERLTHNEIVEMLLGIDEVNFTPGERQFYSNTGYVLLAEIIERKCNKPFQEVMKEKFLNPLGMKKSMASNDYLDLIENKAYSYLMGQTGIFTLPPQMGSMGASGVFSSLNEMTLWANNFYDTQLGKINFYERMKEPTVLNSGEKIEYGMGLQFENYKGVDIVFHGGGTDGYRSYLLHAPAHNLSLVFLSNAGGFIGLDVTYGVLESLLGGYLEEPKTAFEDLDISTFEGIYELVPGSYTEVRFENDSLFMNSYGSPYWDYLERSGNQYFEFAGNDYCKFTFSDEGYQMRYSDMTYTCPKVVRPEEQMAEDDLNKYIGVYVNETYNVMYRLVLRGNSLVLIEQGQPKKSLERFSGNVYYVPFSNFGKLDFEFSEKSEVVGFKLSRQSVEGVTFKKIADCN